MGIKGNDGLQPTFLANRTAFMYRIRLILDYGNCPELPVYHGCGVSFLRNADIPEWLHHQAPASYS